MTTQWNGTEKELTVDRFVLDDTTESAVYAGLKEVSAGKIDIIFDRIVPPNSEKAALKQKELMAFSEANQIPLFLGRGTTAWILSETEETLQADFENAPGRRLLQAGDVVLGLTEEVAGAGAVGALGLTVTPKEMQQALATGKFRVPAVETLAVQVRADRTDRKYKAPYVKDAALAFLQQLEKQGVTLAQKRVLLGTEEPLSQDAQVQLLVTLKKAGVYAVLFTAESLPETALVLDLAERGAYSATNGYAAVQALSRVPRTEIKTVFLGGACGGGIDELRLVAELLKGRKVAFGKRLSVAPATAAVYVQAADEGLITAIMEAGGLVLNQCARPEIQARIGHGEIMVTNDLENADGYAGFADSRVYVMSTEKAVEAAVSGTMGEARTEKKQEQQEAEDLVLEGRTWKFGDDIDTDIIIPTQHLTYPSMEEIKKHAFEPLRPELAAQLREGDIIVAGNNFGCGSSREQAAEVILANGVHCIVAKSFARIFFRNAINNGILLIESPDLADHIQEGDRIRVDLKKQEIIANGQHFPIPAIPENLYRIIADGGLVKNVEKRMKAQGGRA